MKQLLIFMLFIGAYKITTAQLVGGGVMGELHYTHNSKYLFALEGKGCLFNQKQSSEIETNTSVALEGSYIFRQRHLHPSLGLGIQYHFNRPQFSFLLLSGIESNSFVGAFKLLIGTEELGGEASGVLFPWHHHKLGIGFFIEAIPILTPTYAGGLKLCFRVHHDHGSIYAIYLNRKIRLFVGGFFICFFFCFSYTERGNILFYLFSLMRSRHPRKSFTLIELIIVMAIIGTLSVTLVPKVLSVQSRARDTQRKIDIAQIATALTVYKADYTTLLPLSGRYSSYELIQPLVTSGSYMKSIPRDSIEDKREGVVPIFGGSPPPVNSGSYAFTILKRNGVVGDGFGLMARTETHALSNWVYIINGLFAQALNANDGIESYSQSCRSVVPAAQGLGFLVPGGVCGGSLPNEIRYIYIQ